MELIACISENNGLGYNDGRLLFNIKNDLKRFQSITTQGEYRNIVILGRKSAESIIEMNGKLLPKRINAIITRNKEYQANHGEIVFHDVDSIVNHCQTLTDNDKKVFICGGSEVYSLFMKHVNKIHLTHVHKTVEDSEVFYPIELQESLGFIEIERSETLYDKKNNACYHFSTYEKRNK